MLPGRFAHEPISVTASDVRSGHLLSSEDAVTQCRKLRRVRNRDADHHAVSLRAPRAPRRIPQDRTRAPESLDAMLRRTAPINTGSGSVEHLSPGESSMASQAARSSSRFGARDCRRSSPGGNVAAISAARRGSACTRR